MLSFSCTHRYPTGFALDLEFSISTSPAALFGPSGSGKTSLLSMLAGLLRPDRGRITLGDRLLCDTARRICLPPEARRIGLVFQDHLLFPHLSVRRNLEYGAARRRGPRPMIPLARVAEVLEIGPLLERAPHTLSGGERQRVAVGRALLSQPDLLLLDEPVAALDEPLQRKVLNYVERVVAEWNIPTLFVSHDQSAVRRFARWVCVIQAGRLVVAGPPEEALGRPELLAWPGAAGPLNLLRVDQPQLIEGHWTGRIAEQTIHLPAPQLAEMTGPLFVEFTPHDVMLSRAPLAGVSARNHLAGTVRQCVTSPLGIFVAIDVGQILWAHVTPHAATELQLVTGQPILCHIKTTSLKLVL